MNNKSEVSAADSMHRAWVRATAAGATALGTLAAGLVLALYMQGDDRDWLAGSLLAVGAVAVTVFARWSLGLAREARRLADNASLFGARLDSIAHASGGWAWETDTAGRITYCCAGAELVVGEVPGGILGKNFAELGFSPAPAVQTGASPASQLEISLNRTGEPPRRFFCTLVEARNEAGELTGLRGICRDITATEREAGKLRALEENVSQADKAGMLDYVVSGIAHELNQPLAAVSAYCDASQRLLRQNPGSIDEVLTALAAASNQAKSASLVVKRMRGFMMRREPRATVCSLDALVGDALALAAIRLQQEGAHVECRISPELPRVRADTILMVQVILNLLYNALDAMSERPDRLVSISAADDGDGWMAVSIADNGTGIEDEKLSQVFNPYFTTKPDGLGLGLPICVSILEAHGSTLVLERNDAGGCTARFRLEQEVFSG